MRVNLSKVLCVIFIIAFSCTPKNDKIDTARLAHWDSLIDSRPANISDSLKTIDQKNLSRDNRAYYHLLKVISDDKTYVNFKNDSLINSVVNYYKNHDSKSNNYIRSLAYQGIVRTRMGINDSTVFEPLKEADRLFHQQNTPDPSIGYMIHYFLGNINYNSRNFDVANTYFHDALTFARLENDSLHIFDTFFASYWSLMAKEDFINGKLYLDSLSFYYNILTDKRHLILNAQSTYHDIRGEHEIALEKEKMKLPLALSQNNTSALSKVYYNLSDRYSSLNKIDSAMHYAVLAIEYASELDDSYNYLLYENVASIAEKTGNFNVSNNYRKTASELYQKFSKERFSTQIIELEKKYDLTEAENEILKTRQHNLTIIITALIIGIILSVLLMITWRNRKNTKIKLLETEYKMQQKELEANILNEEANKRKWLLLLYSNISDRLSVLQEQFEKLTQKYVSSQPKVYNSMQKILQETQSEIKDIPKELVSDEKTFYYFTNVHDNNNLFNEKEKLFLMLLSCQANNKQIATFMNTSLDSIRVRKSQLKKKLLQNDIDPQNFFL